MDAYPVVELKRPAVLSEKRRVRAAANVSAGRRLPAGDSVILEGYRHYWHHSVRDKYSGTAMLLREEPLWDVA